MSTDSKTGSFQIDPMIRGLGIAAASLALAAGVLFPNSYPSYLDYDAATEAIFVSNHNYQPTYDHDFRTSSFWLDRYVANFAAARLPFTIPLALLQAALGVEPHEMAAFSKITAAILGWIGCLAAALPSFHSRNRSAFPLFFVLGTSFIYPAMFLFVRNGACFFVLSFALFWMNMWALSRHLATRQNRYLYMQAVFIACFALNPYPPLLALPPAMLLLLAMRGRTLRTLRNRHTYGALFLSLALFFTTDFAIGVSTHESYPQYRERVSDFFARRSGAISWDDHLARGSIRDKRDKYLDQHLHFSRDSLGDRWRDDELWTLGTALYSVYCALPFALVGLILAIRSRAIDGGMHLSVLAAVMAVFFSVSFPEGRYILVLVPCYMVFLYTGFEWVFRKPRLRALVATAFILCLAGETLYHVTHRYDRFMSALWMDRDGLREVAEYLPAPPADGTAYVSFDVRDERETWLYFLMNSNFKAEWIPFEDLMQLVAEERSAPSANRYYYSGQASATVLIESLKQRGFSSIESFTSDPGSKRFELLRWTAGSSHPGS